MTLKAIQFMTLSSSFNFTPKTHILMTLAIKSAENRAEEFAKAFQKPHQSVVTNYERNFLTFSNITKKQNLSLIVDENKCKFYAAEGSEALEVTSEGSSCTVRKKVTQLKYFAES